MSRILLGCVAAASITLASAAQGLELRGAATQCSLPADFAIADGKDVAPALRGFLGQFSGYWGDKQYHTVIVSEIAADGDAAVYYAHEKFGPWELKAPWCGRVPAKISDGVLTLTVAGARAVARYRLAGPDILQGSFERGGRTTLGVFRREK